MYAVRRWSVRHARLLEGFYQRFERVLDFLQPVWDWIGHERLDRPVAFIERNVKGLMFDCQMCGRCVLSSTGMSCPMNCPKQLRNGPCGGVRANGNCEVKPEMRCVWVEAYEGSRQMRNGDRILTVQVPVDRTFEGTSSWLREMRRLKAQRDADQAAKQEAEQQAA